MYINRTVAVINVKAPFVEWLNSLPDVEKLTLEEIENIAHVVLLPEDTLDDESLTIQTIGHYWEKMALHVFREWASDMESWPENFSMEDFDKWFDLALLDSAVADLVEEPLNRN